MNMMQRLDDYTERLRVRIFSDEMVSQYYNTLKAFDDGERERVEIHTAEYPGHRWGLGYSITFADGRSSFLPPSLAQGYFRSEKDAVFYMLKYLLSFPGYFSENAVREFKRLLMLRSQSELF